MITETIKTDSQNALKARDALRVSVLRGALSSFTNELVAKGKKPTDQLEDADAFGVLKRLAKQRKEASEQFTKGNRPELAEKELEELKIIEEYLPEQASAEQIEAVVKTKMEGVDKDDKAAVGKLMGAVMQEFKGNADGALVKQIVDKCFS